MSAMIDGFGKVCLWCTGAGLAPLGLVTAGALIWVALI